MPDYYWNYCTFRFIVPRHHFTIRTIQAASHWAMKIRRCTTRLQPGSSQWLGETLNLQFESYERSGFASLGCTTSFTTGKSLSMPTVHYANIVAMSIFKDDVRLIFFLLYCIHRLKILRTGLSAQTDENTYTSFWVAPDFVALQTGIPGLISKGFVNENHFTPSAWRRALSRGKLFAKGTNVDAYYLARDNHVDVIFENIGSPTCTNHGKHDDD